MTLKELSRFYYLGKEIERDKRRLEELKSLNDIKGTVYTGMPSGGRVIPDKMVERLVTVLDLEKSLQDAIANRLGEEIKLMNYINSIDDCFVRLIFKLRFIDCKTWWQVAREVGGNNTDDSVKKMCYRYLDKGCHKCPNA